MGPSRHRCLFLHHLVNESLESREWLCATKSATIDKEMWRTARLENTCELLVGSNLSLELAAIKVALELSHVQTEFCSVLRFGHA